MSEQERSVESLKVSCGGCSEVKMVRRKVSRWSVRLEIFETLKNHESPSHLISSTDHVWRFVTAHCCLRSHDEVCFYANRYAIARSSHQPGSKRAISALRHATHQKASPLSATTPNSFAFASQNAIRTYAALVPQLDSNHRTNRLRSSK